MLGNMISAKIQCRYIITFNWNYIQCVNHFDNPLKRLGLYQYGSYIKHTMYYANTLSCIWQFCRNTFKPFFVSIFFISYNDRTRNEHNILHGLFYQKPWIFTRLYEDRNRNSICIEQQTSAMCEVQTKHSIYCHTEIVTLELMRNVAWIYIVYFFL